MCELNLDMWNLKIAFGYWKLIFFPDACFSEKVYIQYIFTKKEGLGHVTMFSILKRYNMDFLKFPIEIF